ncbi:DUF945 family protein [Parathalassolituus penaei]|uniref:DUF945 family protein n=1 Tax=Parathalassolituus penaei TaxID=2997323 RepID=A0A9X3ECL4_9GAMM|nr:DUF945 family protein [Parathalassolituus penaei]MCY0965087.1 DUF945 family protein [Parathalassolituus penaei]
MKYLVSGVAVLALTGSGWAQYQLGQEVGARVDEQLNPETLSRWSGVPVEVLANDQQRGLLETRGSVRLATPTSDVPVDMTVEYVIHHSLLGGIHWEADLPTLYVGGPVNLSLTDQMFAGKPLHVSGEMGLSKATGTLLVPETNWLVEDNDRLSIEAFPVQFQLELDGDNRLSAYESKAEVPPMHLDGTDVSLLVSGLSWEHRYEGSPEHLLGQFDLTIHEIRENSSLPVVASGITNHVETRIATEVASTMSFGIETINSPLGTMNNLLLQTSFGGLDGSLTRQLLDQLDDAGQSGDPELVMEELSRFLEQHADQWFARAPWFRLDHFRFDQGDEPFIDLSGNLTLQTGQLPDDFFSVLMKGDAVDSQALMGVLDASVDMALSQDAIALATLSNPLMGDLLASNGPAISFRISQGQMTLNGNRL